MAKNVLRGELRAAFGYKGITWYLLHESYGKEPIHVLLWRAHSTPVFKVVETTCLIMTSPEKYVIITAR